MSIHLWEVKHPYYCSETNYFANDEKLPPLLYHSWADFFADWGGNDVDLNLVFRWDWEPSGEDWYDSDKTNDGRDEYHATIDDNYRGYTLKLFYMLQRKGLFRSIQVEVCRADEPKVAEFLQPRLNHLAGMWLPLNPAQGGE